MINEEFSDGFDVLLNSYASKIGFGDQTAPIEVDCDEYEKSVFLTQAQEDEVLSLYNGMNARGESFENTEEVRRYLAPLIREGYPAPLTNSQGNPIGMHEYHKFFSISSFLDPGNKDKVWFITYESVKVSNTKCGEHILDVLPVRQDEYNRIKRNPFRGPNSRRALRLDLSNDNVEIICDKQYDICEYYIRYLKRPKPIVLTDLEGVSVEGETTSSENCCELPESLHQKILERAVLKALSSKGYKINNTENK